MKYLQLKFLKWAVWCIFVLFFSFSCDSSDAPERKSWNKVLVIGNSITFHPPNESIGWNNNCGMAASAPEKDYYSVLQQYFRSVNPEVEMKRQNVYPFIVDFENFDFSNYDSLKEFGADLILVRLGENVNSDWLNEDNFAEALTDFVLYLKGSPSTEVLVGTNFWPNAAVSDQLYTAAEKNNWKLVDLSHLGVEDKYMALGEYEHEGVSRHPNDAGMAEIARLIWEKLNEEINF